MAKAAMTLTDAAQARVKELLARRDPPAKALKIGVTTRGCSGLSYDVSYADEWKPLDEVIELDGARVVVDGSALMFLLGSEMDYVEDKMQSGFVFRNPNEKDRCGCGESFRV